MGTDSASSDRSTLLRGVAFAVVLEIIAALMLFLGKVGPCGPGDPLAMIGVLLHLPAGLVVSAIFIDSTVSEAWRVVVLFGLQVAFFSCLTVPLAQLLRWRRERKDPRRR